MAELNVVKIFLYKIGAQSYEMYYIMFYTYIKWSKIGAPIPLHFNNSWWFQGNCFILHPAIEIVAENQIIDL